MRNLLRKSDKYCTLIYGVCGNGRLTSAVAWPRSTCPTAAFPPRLDHWHGFGWIMLTGTWVRPSRRAEFQAHSSPRLDTPAPTSSCYFASSRGPRTGVRSHQGPLSRFWHHAFSARRLNSLEKRLASHLATLPSLVPKGVDYLPSSGARVTQQKIPRVAPLFSTT